MAKPLNPLPRAFYARDAAVVAKELLGKLLVRKLNNKLLIGKIVETEAYYGRADPASRAYKGRTKIGSVMFEKPGTILTYCVHANYMFNIVTGKQNKPEAVLIRAVEPLNFKSNLSGPGRLSRAFRINAEHNRQLINKEVFIFPSKEKVDIGRSHRVGVSRDLKRKLRFFVKGNKFVSS